MTMSDLDDSRKTVDVAGIRSDVTRKAHPFNETVGHVLFLDCENTEFEELKQWCRENLDVYFIFRSSRNNFHVISPVIRSAIEIHQIKESCPHDDDEHNRIGYSKRGWVLRATDKGDKPRPELLVSCLPVNNRLEHYSLSIEHLKYIRDEYSESDVAFVLNSDEFDLTLLGHALKIVQYGTYEKHEGE